MALNLVQTLGSNFMKDYPGQNATNCDLEDAYANASLTTHPLKTFSPPLTASTTDPVLGTGGFSTARYYEIFDQIYIWGEWRFGTASINVGSGIYILTLPFTVRSLLGPNATLDKSPIVGSGTLFDASANAGRLPVTVHLRATNQIYFGIRMNSGSGNRELRNSGYLTWDINDGVSWNARFQRSP